MTAAGFGGGSALTLIPISSTIASLGWAQAMVVWGIIQAIVVLVAAFNVISSLIMLVKDKRADIAVLRTLGAGSGSVLRIFLLCGAFVGVSGADSQGAAA